MAWKLIVNAIINSNFNFGCMCAVFDVRITERSVFVAGIECCGLDDRNLICLE